MKLSPSLVEEKNVYKRMVLVQLFSKLLTIKVRNPFIVDTIGKYFNLAFTGHSELMFLNCNGWENFGYDKKNYEGITDCGPYFSDGTPTPTNRLAMKEWSHDREHDDIMGTTNQNPHGIDVSYSIIQEICTSS